MPILEARDVHYAYETHRVLRGVSLALERGKLYAILGPSGCGKTTLLSLLGGLDSPTQGQLLFDGEDIAQHGLAGTGETMCPSCSKPIISSTTSPRQKTWPCLEPPTPSPA